MIAGAVRGPDSGQTLAFDHAMAPVLALCGQKRHGADVGKRPADWAIVSDGGSGNTGAARAALGIKAASTRRNER